eukprot:6417198-Amphidinium_carterae.1
MTLISVLVSHLPESWCLSSATESSPTADPTGNTSYLLSWHVVSTASTAVLSKGTIHGLEYTDICAKQKLISVVL